MKCIRILNYQSLFVTCLWTVVLTVFVPGQNLQAQNASSDASTLAAGLDFPTAVAFSSTRLWVSEAGIINRALTLPPKIKEIEPGGVAKTILSSSMLPPGHFEGPVLDLAFGRGWLWVAHQQVGANGLLVNAISRFSPDNPAATFTTVSTGFEPIPLHLRIRAATDLVVKQRRARGGNFSLNGFHRPIDVEFDQGAMLVVDFGAYEPKLRSLQAGTGKVLLVQPQVRTWPGAISGALPSTQSPQMVANVIDGRDEERPITSTSIIPPFSRPGTISGAPPPNQAPAVITTVVGGRDEERPIFGTPVISPVSRQGNIRGAATPNQPPVVVTSISGGRDEERPIFGTSVIPPFTRPGTLSGAPPPDQPPALLTTVTPGVDSRRFTISVARDETLPKQEQPWWRTLPAK